MTRPAAPTSKVAGTHFEAVEEDPTWRAIEPDLARPCRQRKDRDGQRDTCRVPSVVALNRARASSSSAQWWHYCAVHSFGRWVEDGKVLVWRLTDDEVPE